MIIPPGGGGDEQILLAVGGIAEPRRVTESLDPAGSSVDLVRGQIDIAVGAQDHMVLDVAFQVD
ncbi:hypothetical protein JOF56_009879 [Kibdelosporangium banguiense]|uniref:Uncharacterized protein n=1 Tax=Kibdelosporangium banguiense TaxID=1365924 RepID=A0ABS4TYL4_9PSEU|nr:hypothetical protein [Kibdelosporangium banguiense]MBP2329494.1 hypothetical protein [Kibdelosporangium banguiense]